MPKQSHLRRSLDTTKAQTDIKAPEGGYAVIITAELPPELERGGDVIRVKGMRLPKEVPLLAQHMHAAQDGSPTVIGKANNFRHTKTRYDGHECAAIAADIFYADSDLAKKYKQLWPEYIKDVSVGLMVKEAEPLNKNDPWGGYDYTQTELFELSVVAIPANPAASLIRTLKDTFGDDIKLPEVSGTVTVPVVADLEPIKKQLDSIVALAEELKSLVAQVSKLNDQLDPILKRFDDIEDAITAKAEDARQPSGRKSEPSPEKVKALLSLL